MQDVDGTPAAELGLFVVCALAAIARAMRDAGAIDLPGVECYARAASILHRDAYPSASALLEAFAVYLDVRADA